MKTLLLIAGLALLGCAGRSDSGQANIRANQPDGNHMVISCANSADPTIKASDGYNTIVISCVDERTGK